MTDWNCLKALIAKDLKLFFLHGGGLGQALLLGLLLIFLFSLSQGSGENISPQAAATLFWLASAFCMVLIFNNLFGLDEENNAKTGLHLLPCHIIMIWLGKAFCGFLFILITQIVFLPCMLIFLDMSLSSNFLLPIGAILCINLGMAACGSLLGSLSAGQTGKESLLSIILFPLLTPLLLGGIQVLSLLFKANGIPNGDSYTWMGIILAFDGVFIGASLLLFPFLYKTDH